MKTRLSEIDMVRGITISLVVLGHTSLTDSVDNFFTAFRLPLFFLVSGFLISHQKYIHKYKEFVVGRVWRLLVPYASVYAVSWIWWYAIFSDEATKSDFNKSLYGILSGNGSDLVINVPIWFLPCLFCADLIFMALLNTFEKYSLKIHLKIIIFLIIGTGGVLIGNYVSLPWGIDIALTAQVFMYTGFLLKKVGLYKEFKIPIWLILLSVGLYLIDVIWNSTIDMNNRMYNNEVLFYLGGLSGALIVLRLVNLLKHINFIQQGLSWIGKRSIVILAFHSLTFVVYDKICNILHISLSYPILHMIWALGVSIILAMIFNQFKLTRILFLGMKNVKEVKTEKLIAA